MTSVPSLVPPSGMLREYVDLYAPTGEAPEEAHLGAAIALVSAAVGWRAWIKWAENAEPCTVNVVLEGRSATARKTTVANSAHAIARAAMTSLPDSMQRLRVRHLSHTSQRGLLEVVAAPDRDTAARWEDEPPPGNLLVWDEFGSVLGRPGDVKGSDWLGQVRTTLMQLTGGRHGGLQLGGEKLPPGRCAVSILATMTRVELEQRVSTGLLRDGFLGRFVLVPHNGRRAWLAEPPPWSADMVRRKERIIEWLRSLAQLPGAFGHVFDRLTPEARDWRRGWYLDRGKQLEQRADDTGSESALATSEAFGRLQTTALKIALVAAVAEWEPADDPRSLWIGEEHVRYGAAFADYALDEIGKLAYEAGTPEERYAQKVLTWLDGRGQVRTRDLAQSVRAPGLSTTQRRVVIDELVQNGDVEVAVKRMPSGQEARVISRAPHREGVEGVDRCRHEAVYT